MRLVRAALLLAVMGCAAAPRRARPVPDVLPAAPPHITVVYPDTAVPIQAHDSSFLFGNVTRRRGDVTLTLTIDGRPVPVLATGAWLAWVPLPDDTIAAFRLVARAPPDSEVTVFTARIAPTFRPLPGATVWIDTTSFTPIDTLVAPAGEGIRRGAGPRARPGPRPRAGRARPRHGTR